MKSKNKKILISGVILSIAALISVITIKNNKNKHINEDNLSISEKYDAFREKELEKRMKNMTEEEKALMMDSELQKEEILKLKQLNQITEEDYNEYWHLRREMITESYLESNNNENSGNSNQIVYKPVEFEIGRGRYNKEAIKWSEIDHYWVDNDLKKIDKESEKKKKEILSDIEVLGQGLYECPKDILPGKYTLEIMSGWSLITGLSDEVEDLYIFLSEKEEDPENLRYEVEIKEGDVVDIDEVCKIIFRKNNK